MFSSWVELKIPRILFMLLVFILKPRDVVNGPLVEDSLEETLVFIIDTLELLLPSTPI